MAESKLCPRCKNMKTFEDYKTHKNGKISKTCLMCLDKVRLYTQKCKNGYKSIDQAIPPCDDDVAPVAIEQTKETLIEGCVVVKKKKKNRSPIFKCLSPMFE